MTRAGKAFLFLAMAVRLAVTDGQASKGCRADICFVMDESGSIGMGNWQTSVQFVADFVSRTAFGNVGTMYGVVKFSDTASLAIKLNQYTSKVDLISAIRNLPYDSGGTSIDAGIREAREQCFKMENGDRPAEYAPNILILMTDGQSDKNAAVQEANLARSEGIIIVSIGIGGYDLETLREIADSKDGERLFTFENFDLLLNDISLILGESCKSIRDCERGQLVQLTGDYPNIADCPTLSDPYLVNDVLIEFSCEILYNESLVEPGARYNVTFLFDGVADAGVPSVVLTPPSTSVILKERYLHGRLNKYISCQVESYYVTSAETSPAVRSRRYWAGIAPSKRAIDLYEGDQHPTDLFLFSSLPISCDFSGQRHGGCSLTLLLSTQSDRIAMYQPSIKNYTEIRSCTFRLFYKDWKANESLAYDEKGPLQLLAKRDPQSSSPTSYHLSVQINVANKRDEHGSFTPAFDGYQPPNVTITVHDQKPAVCRTRNDPWIKTFDSSGSYAAMQQGYFVYVTSNSSRKLEIHGRHFACRRGGGAGCSVPCAVAVREGKYIMALDNCNDENMLHTLGLTTSSVRRVNSLYLGERYYGMVMTANPARTEYMIKTVGGARVVVTLRSRGMNIEITLSSRHFDRTAGLCGTFDNNPGNDQVPKGGTTPGDRDVFIESWRLSSKDSLFFKAQPEDTDDTSELFCHCADDYNRTTRPIAGAECGLNALEDPLADIDNPREYVRTLIPKYILKGTKKRKKREMNEEGFRSDDVTDYVPTASYDTRENDEPPMWNAINITETEAMAACEQAIRQSSAMSQCDSVKNTSEYRDMIDTCLKDIRRTGSLEWAADRRREFERHCIQTIITQNVTDRRMDRELMLKQTAQKITALLCPGNCNNHGRCVSGTCHCDTDYLGADCSIKRSEVPVIKKYLNQGDCDITDAECSVVRVVVDRVANTPNLTCKVTIIKSNGGGTEQKVYKGYLETSNIVRCPLPPVKEVANDVVGYSYKVQISNDRVNYSPAPQQPVTVVDSKCTSCVNNTCVQKPNTCIIDGKCYTTGEDVNECLMCNSSKNAKAGTPKSGLSPMLVTNKVLYKLDTETSLIKLESSSDAGAEVIYTLRGMYPGVSITPTGMLTWKLGSQNLNVTVRLEYKACPQTVYKDFRLSLVILSCRDICGENADCIPNSNAHPGYGNYTCRCKTDQSTYCHPGACPPNAPCMNLTCGYKCQYPSGTWSSWSGFGVCSKRCDYGLKTRTRRCLGSPCFGLSEEFQVCNAFNCPENENQIDQSITLEFQQISVEKVVLKRKVLISFIASSLNEYCGRQPDTCCKSVQLRTKSNPVGADEMIKDDNIMEAVGYPRSEGQNVRLRLYAELYTTDVSDVCIIPESKRRKRALLAEYRTVNPALLTAVLSGKLAEMGDIVQTGVTIVQSDSTTDRFIIIVASVGTILTVIAVVVVVAVLAKRKKKASTPAVRPNRSRFETNFPAIDTSASRGNANAAYYDGAYAFPYTTYNDGTFASPNLYRSYSDMSLYSRLYAYPVRSVAPVKAT